MQKVKSAATALSLWFFIFLGANAQSPQEFGKFAKQVLNDWQTPGAAVAVVQDDSIVFAQGYGVRTLGKADKVDRNTLFAVASNTKAFTAALLGLLVDEGKIKWDDAVGTYRPDFQMFDPYVSRNLSFRDLLIHRSGLSTFGGDHLWIGHNLSRDEIISRLRYLEPTRSFRTHFQYQNLMFLVAGEMIPTITGQSWDEAMQETFFEPLGMKSTNLSIRDLEGQSNVASPHESVDGGPLQVIPYDFLDNIAPAAAINSNVMDMAQWMILNMNNGRYRDTQILPENLINEMQRVQFPLGVSKMAAELLEAKFAGYGLGWGISEYNGYKSVGHGGGMSGMISQQMMLPEKKLGVIVLTNRAPTTAHRILCYTLLDHYLGIEGRDWNQIYLQQKQRREEYKTKRQEKLYSERHLDTKPSLPLSSYVGTYSSLSSGKAKMNLKDGKLVFDYNARHIGTLEHWHYDTFRVHWKNPISDMEPVTFLQFKLKESGDVKELTVTFYDPLTFVRENE
ncbi:MAG: serine hydrolase [Calditrichaeota bacterium]|nr:MAG: serine hydrolase [Calditrichota bacterium]